MLSKDQVKSIIDVYEAIRLYIEPIYNEYQLMRAIKYNDKMYTIFGGRISDFEITKTHVWINDNFFSDYGQVKMPIGWLYNKNWRSQAKRKITKEYNEKIMKQLRS